MYSGQIRIKYEGSNIHLSQIMVIIIFALSSPTNYRQYLRGAEDHQIEIYSRQRRIKHEGSR